MLPSAKKFATQGGMKTRAELNARLMLAGMPKGTYAKLFRTTPQIVARHGHQHRIPPVAEAIVRAWEIMTPDQRASWIAQEPEAGEGTQAQNGGPK